MCVNGILLRPYRMPFRPERAHGARALTLRRPRTHIDAEDGSRVVNTSDLAGEGRRESFRLLSRISLHARQKSKSEGM